MRISEIVERKSRGMIITSQDYIDATTVAEKSANADYDITVSPDFVVDGVTMCVLLDGHHSLAAAIADGVDPVVTVATQSDNDTVALLDRGDIGGFLEVSHMGTDYRDAITGAFVF